MCHCVSDPPTSGTVSSVAPGSSMYIAATSFFSPVFRFGSYTSDSGWSGSRMRPSLRFVTLMKCSSPVSASPIDLKPAASAVL